MKAIKGFLLAALLSVVALSAGMAHAGAGANVNACVYFATKPATALTVNVTPGGSGTHCMNDTGKATTITVTSAGVTCSSVGYVEAKASSTKGDLCATDKSKWPLSYSIPGTAYSGGTQSQWNTGTQNNSMDLDNQPAGTNVCGQGALCPSTSWTWNAGSQGPLYIIFQPGYTGK
jgi:hypothetical protein